MSSNQKVIVTGASGNLGMHIVKTGLFNFIPVGRQNWNELSELKNGEVDFVIHCAYDLKKDLNQFPEEHLESNILTTGKILKLCKDKGIKNFVFISSCSVYGDSSNSSETKASTPVNMNGFIKQFNEELVKSFCLKNNINFLILRLFNSYGGNDQFSMVQRIIKASRNHTPITLYNEGISERDFIHIEDAAEIICKLLDKKLINETINIGSGESTRIVDLVNAVIKRLGPIEIFKEQKANEAIYSRANITKLNSILDFEFKNIFDYINTL